jgi:hypothetical protein
MRSPKRGGVLTLRRLDPARAYGTHPGQSFGGSAAAGVQTFSSRYDLSPNLSLPMQTRQNFFHDQYDNRKLRGSPSAPKKPLMRGAVAAARVAPPARVAVEGLPQDRNLG